MAATVAQFPYIIVSCSIPYPESKCSGFSRHFNDIKFTSVFTTAAATTLSSSSRLGPRRKKTPCLITCFAANKPSPSSEISSTARIRSEVLTPYRSVRMFFYLAFIASASLGGLIATTQLIAALANPSKAAAVPEIAKGLGIDIVAVSIFAFLYSRDNAAKNAQLARLSREENLSKLKLRVDEKRVIPVADLRGIARLVILAGPASFIVEAFKLSEPFTEKLLERGVLVVPFATDGNSPSFEFKESEEMGETTDKRKRLWRLVPAITNDWSEYLLDVFKG